MLSSLEEQSFVIGDVLKTVDELYAARIDASHRGKQHIKKPKCLRKSINAANSQAYWGYGVGNRVWGYTEAGQGWQGNGYGYVKECEKIRAATSAVAVAAGITIVGTVVQLARMFLPKNEPQVMIVNNYYYDYCPCNGYSHCAQ
jgi:hypothetical protein